MYVAFNAPHTPFHEPPTNLCPTPTCVDSHCGNLGPNRRTWLPDEDSKGWAGRHDDQRFPDFAMNSLPATSGGDQQSLSEHLKHLIESERAWGGGPTFPGSWPGWPAYAVA